MVVELCEADKIMYKEGALENAPLAGELARSPKDKCLRGRTLD